MKLYISTGLMLPGASLVADSETTDLTAGNVATSLSYLVGRTVFSSDTAAGISIDLGEEREIGRLSRFSSGGRISRASMRRTYFDATDTIRIRLSADTPDAVKYWIQVPSPPAVSRDMAPMPIGSALRSMPDISALILML